MDKFPHASWKILKSICKLCAAIILLLLPFSRVKAQVTSATVRPDQPLLEIGLGQVEMINIVLENAEEVYGIDVRLHFDPAVVEVIDADPDREGVQIVPGKFPQPDFLVCADADNQAGAVQYVITQVNPTPPASGMGVVFSIQLRGKSPGGQSDLTIDFVEIADRHGMKLSVHPESGLLVVVPTKPPTPTPAVRRTPTAEATAVAELEADSLMPDSQAAPTGATLEAVPCETGLSDSTLMMIAIAGFASAIILLGGVVIFRKKGSLQ